MMKHGVVFVTILVLGLALLPADGTGGSEEFIERGEDVVLF